MTADAACSVHDGRPCVHLHLHLHLQKRRLRPPQSKPHAIYLAAETGAACSRDLVAVWSMVSCTWPKYPAVEGRPCTRDTNGQTLLSQESRICP